MRIVALGIAALVMAALPLAAQETIPSVGESLAPPEPVHPAGPDPYPAYATLREIARDVAVREFQLVYQGERDTIVTCANACTGRLEAFAANCAEVFGPPVDAEGYAYANGRLICLQVAQTKQEECLDMRLLYACVYPGKEMPRSKPLLALEAD